MRLVAIRQHGVLVSLKEVAAALILGACLGAAARQQILTIVAVRFVAYKDSEEKHRGVSERRQCYGRL